MRDERNTVKIILRQAQMAGLNRELNWKTLKLNSNETYLKKRQGLSVARIEKSTNTYKNFAK